MKIFGWIFSICGALIVAIALFLIPSTVETERMTSLSYGGQIGTGEFTDTYNLPRAQNREFTLDVGGLLFLGGIILLVGGVLDDRLLGRKSAAFDWSDEGHGLAAPASHGAVTSSMEGKLS